MLHPRRLVGTQGSLFPCLLGMVLVLACPGTADAARVHRVQPGETLFRIAKRYGVTVEWLARVNGLADPGRIQAGQRLIIPEPEKREDRPPSLPPRTHVVQRGETLYRIALRYSTTVAALIEANGLTSDRILAGQTLRIPPVRVSLGGGGTPLFGDPGQVVRRAMDWLGTPYRWGGSSKEGMDCSGLVYVVFTPWIPDMPRSSFAQFRMGKPVGRGELVPGDLVFFTTYAPGASHVGIYLGEGRFIHSAQSAGGVTITPLDDPYYAVRYLGARRLLHTQRGRADS